MAEEELVGEQEISWGGNTGDLSQGKVSRTATVGVGWDLLWAVRLVESLWFWASRGLRLGTTALEVGGQRFSACRKDGGKKQREISRSFQ